jgi:NhaP-type Na+/H+ and K+/H+ antiporter
LTHHSELRTSAGRWSALSGHYQYASAGMFAVVVSACIQGSTIEPLARRLRLIQP